MKEAANHILPRDKGAAPLDFVIAVMAFLAALALGASLVATRAAHGWQSGLADRITVQIMPPEQGDPRAELDQETRVVLDVLRAMPGIAHAEPLSDAQINALAEIDNIKKNGVTKEQLARAKALIAQNHYHSLETVDGFAQANRTLNYAGGFFPAAERYAARRSFK